MDEQRYVDSLEDLTGRVAIVTGGAAGIGLETTIYLAQKGATVYAASRNREKSEKGIKLAKERLNGKGGSIHFHHLDLSSIAGARQSAAEFRRIESRLDILICNAGICMTYLNRLSKDGYERAFATNHLGHFAFVTSLLDVIEQTAKTTGDARVVVVSSEALYFARKLDYAALEKEVDGDGKSICDMSSAFQRYAKSKLANVYFAAELSRRMRARGIDRVYCNSCHPGMVATTGLGSDDQQPLGPLGDWAIRGVLNVFSNSGKDSARTQTYLAASPDIAALGISGTYWEPVWSWALKYIGCKIEELQALGKDENEQKTLWMYSEEAVARAAP